MIKVILFFIIGYLIYRAVNPKPKRQFPGASTVGGGGSGEIDDVMIQDPFCKAYFPKHDGIPLNFEGRDYHFCSTECRDRFLSSRGDDPNSSET
jgi:YHS domain-containing protein